MVATGSSDLPETPVLPETVISGIRQIPGTAADFAGTPLGVPETGKRECSAAQARLPLPHEYAENSDWPAVLLSRLRAFGCKLEADEEGLTVTCRGPLSDWDAQLLRTWGDAARKRMLGLDLV